MTLASLGLVAGLVVGAIAGALDVAANGYVAAGMPISAAISLEVVATSAAWRGVVAALVVQLLWRLHTRRRARTTAEAARFAVLVGGAVAMNAFLDACTRYSFVSAAERLWRHGLRLAAGELAFARLLGFFHEHAPAIALLAAAVAFTVAAYRLACAWRWWEMLPRLSAAFERAAAWAARVLPQRRLRAAALGAAVLLAGAHGAIALARSAASSDGPNVVIVLSDTLRRDHLGLYGHGRDTSPNLDRLAVESTVFERAVAPSSYTKASVASLFASQYPSQHRALHNEDGLQRSVHTLAEVLREHGYRTYAFSENPVIAEEFGFDQGFDAWEADYRRHKSLENRSMDDFDARIHARIRANRQRRFLLYVHYLDPHDPYLAPGVFRALFASEGPLEGREAEMRAYDREVRYVDARLGGLTGVLRAAGVLDDTLLVFLSDHGEGFGPPDRVKGHASSVYAEVVDVPLVIRYPRGLPAGRREEFVSLVDVYPTVLAAAGIQRPPGLGGSSLLEPEPAPRPLFSEQLMRAENRKSQRCIVRGGWKLVHGLEDDRVEIFDLFADPRETVDRSAARAELAMELRAELDAWLASLGAPREPPRVEIGPERLEQLRGLGYLQ